MTAEPSEFIIQLEGLRRDFHVGDEVVHALNGIDMQIGAGEYLSIMGPSGSGKSTLLYILGLLDVPTAGEYRLAGINTASMNDNERANARQRDIGFIFQSFHLVPRMNAAENVELPLTLAGMAPTERRELVDRALEGAQDARVGAGNPDAEMVDVGKLVALLIDHRVVGVAGGKAALDRIGPHDHPGAQLRHLGMED